MANIHAAQAWDVTTGDASLVVADIDTGIDRSHPDLAANMWTNPGEIEGNGIDDDGNGYVDDIHGWDWAYGDNDPMDVHGHGTHTSGTVGAVGNNGVGVAGVNWNVKLMALKFLNDSGSGSTSNAIAALNYALAKGVKVSNNSWAAAAIPSRCTTRSTTPGSPTTSLSPPQATVAMTSAATTTTSLPTTPPPTTWTTSSPWQRSPAATPVPSASMHVGDLDGSCASNRNRWQASVTILMDDQDGQHVANAQVTGSWSTGATSTCTTGTDDRCTTTLGGLKRTASSVTFTVDGVSHATLGYKPTANTDLDGDSDGTSIIVSQ